MLPPGYWNHYHAVCSRLAQTAIPATDHIGLHYSATALYKRLHGLAPSCLAYCQVVNRCHILPAIQTYDPQCVGCLFHTPERTTETVVSPSKVPPHAQTVCLEPATLRTGDILLDTCKKRLKTFLFDTVGYEHTAHLGNLHFMNGLAFTITYHLRSNSVANVVFSSPVWVFVNRTLESFEISS